MLAQHLCVGKQGKALHLHAQAAALIPQLFPVGGLFVGGLAVEHIRRVDVALNEGNALLGGRSAQLVVQALAGQGDVPLEAALYPGVVGLAHRTGGQHHVEQLGLFGVAAGGADADDVVHIVELEQLIRIDADGRHAHAAAHHADGAALIGAGKAQHAAHTGHLTHILQEGVGNELGAQRVTGHEDRLGEIALFGAVVRGRHRTSLLFLYDRQAGPSRWKGPLCMLTCIFCG